MQYFEEKGIWYLPLKGIVLQQYYPKIGMRQMCDNDILFDAAFRRDLRDQMAKDGYTVYMYGLPFHDTYIKGIFNFEMHHSLYHDSEDTHTFCDYYRDVASRLLPVKEGSMERKFSDEDFYIHCISHAYKHFTSGGTGIRSVLDVFVYLRNKSDTLDFSYMERELKKLGLWEYHSTMQRLAALLFSHEPSAIPHEIKKFSERDREVFLYLLDSGTYGLIEHSVEKRMKEIAGERPISFFTKLRYCFERIFPDMHCYSRHKILIPFYWSYRLFRGVFLKFGKCMGELKAVFKTKS